MAQLPKQAVPLITHQGVDQRNDPFLLAKERLTRANNVHQPRTGVLSKRNGYGVKNKDATAEVNGETLTYELTNGRDLAATEEALAVRTNEGIYLRSEAEEAYLLKAKDSCVQVDPVTVASQYGYRPSSVVVDLGNGHNLTYYFVADAGDWQVAQDAQLLVGSGTILTNRPSRWYWRVVDDAGVEVRALTPITNYAAWMSIPVVVSGKVWLFGAQYDSGLSKVLALKFDPADATTDDFTASTYYSDATFILWGMDVFSASSSTAVVCMMGDPNGGSYNTYMSKLDPATGLPNVTPGLVGSNAGVDPDAQISVQFFHNQRTGSYLVTYCGGLNGTPKALSVAEFNVTTLALTTNIPLASVTTDPHVVATSYRDPVTGHFVTFSALKEGTGSPYEYMMVRWEHQIDGTAAAAYTPIVRYRMYPVTHPFYVQGTGKRYIIAGNDDNGTFTQGSYYLLSCDDLAIVGRALYGEGGGYGQRTCSVVDATDANGGWVSPNVICEERSATVVFSAFNGERFDTRQVKFKFDVPLEDGDRLGPMVPIAGGKEIAVPSAWPKRVVSDECVELCPMGYPNFAPELTNTGSATPITAGDYACRYLYAYIGDDGNIVRSRSSPPQTVTVGAAENILWGMDILTFINGQPPGYTIEMYMTAVDDTSGPMFLQNSIVNLDFVPNVGAVSPTVAHLMVQPDTVIGTELYSTGAATDPLANDPPPPYGISAAWGNRLILSDTDELGSVWVSKERTSPGLSYEFSVDLTFNVTQTSRVRALGAINEQFFAFFSADAIYYIQAPGPDNLGRNMYEPLHLPSDSVGCINQRSVVTTKSGLFFQGTDGRMKLITPSLALVDVNDGIAGFASDPSFPGLQIESAMNHHPTQQIRFFTSHDIPV